MTIGNIMPKHKHNTSLEDNSEEVTRDEDNERTR